MIQLSILIAMYQFVHRDYKYEMHERIEVFHMKRVNFWLLGTLFLWSFSIVSFPVSFDFLSVNQETRTAYSAASNAVSDNDFAIASRRYNQTDLVPLAPAKAIINGVADATNPIYGAGISFFTLMNGHPSGVLSIAPNSPDNKLFYYNAYTDPTAISIITSAPLHDSVGGVAHSIVAFTATSYAVDESSARMYALVKNAAGDNFGAAGSGIVVAALVGAKENQTIASTQAIEISNSSQGLRIGNNVVISNDTYSIPPVLQYNAHIGTLYSGFIVEAAAAIGSGARSVLLGAGEITPTSAIDHNSIIGTSVPGQSAAALHLASLNAINGAAYLIVHGGVFTTSPDEVVRSVYALPLVSSPSSSYMGTLASVKSTPVNGKYTTPALQIGDLYTTTDVPAIVGCSAAPGDITDMWVFNDTVYIAVGYTYKHAHVRDGELYKAFTNSLYAPGIFSSQPLYSSTGAIKGWTAWRRVGVPASRIRSFAADIVDGTYWYIDSGSDVQKTTWKKQATYLDEAFLPQQSGVQGFFDVPETAESMETAIGARSSFFIAVGKNRCVLVETGRDIDNVFTPQYASSNAFVSTNGSLAGLVAENNVLDISGGVVELCGNLNSALVCHNNNGNDPHYYGWIAIAGSDGCALLTKANGAGWDYGLTGLTADMRFVQLTSLVGIRGISCDGTYLYILTPDILARVVLTAANCALGIHAPYTIVAHANSILNLSDPFMQFTTLATDAKRILIGSNRGLITSTTSQPLSQAAGEQNFGWQLVDLPQSAKAISRIMVYSNENLGYAQSLDNAFVCVLSSYVGYEQARLYALDVSADQLPQVIEVNKFPFWYIWSAYRSHFMRSNSIDLVGRSMYPSINEHPFVSRSVSPLIRSSAIKNDMHGVIHFNGNYLNCMGYVSAWGYTVAFDETGMYSNGDSSTVLVD
jgi:hypothetical protein